MSEQNWTLRLNAGDDTRIMTDGGVDAFSLPLCDIKCGGMSGRTVKQGERIAADIVARYNALEGIPDPAAYVAAMRDVVEAGENLRAAQRAYMAERGNEELGKAVGLAATALDAALTRAREVMK